MLATLIAGLVCAPTLAIAAARRAGRSSQEHPLYPSVARAGDGGGNRGRPSRTHPLKMSAAMEDEVTVVRIYLSEADHGRRKNLMQEIVGLLHDKH